MSTEQVFIPFELSIFGGIVQCPRLLFNDYPINPTIADKSNDSFESSGQKAPEIRKIDPKNHEMAVCMTLQNVRKPINKAFRVSKKHSNIVSIFECFCGGGEGSRTPVRKSLSATFSERSQCFKVPPAKPPLTGSSFR